MSNAPEKIWISNNWSPDATGWDEGVSTTGPVFPDDVEYVRADLVEKIRQEAREAALNGDHDYGSTS